MEISDYASLPAVKAALLDGNRIAALTAVRTASGCSLPEAMRIVDALWEKSTVASTADSSGLSDSANPFELEPQLTAAPRDLVFLLIVRQCRRERYDELVLQLPGGIGQWTEQQRMAAARRAEAFMKLSDQLCLQDEPAPWPDYEQRMLVAFPDLPAEAYSIAYNRSMLDAIR